MHHAKESILFFVAAFLPLSAAHGVQAAASEPSASADTPADPSAKNTFIVLPDIVVTATKTPNPTADVPADVSIITEEDIRARHAQYLRDVIDMLPGVSINRGGGQRAVNIRGFDASYSMILINGRRLPSEPNAPYELDRISLSDVKRIEVIRGSASALYGSDALGGVINIITKPPERPACTLQADQSLWPAGGSTSGRYTIHYDTGSKGNTGVSLTAAHAREGIRQKGDGTTYLPFGTRDDFSAHVRHRDAHEGVWTFDASYYAEKLTEYGTFIGMHGIRLPVSYLADNRRQQYALGYRRYAGKAEFDASLHHAVWEKRADTKNRNTNLYANNAFGEIKTTTFEARMTYDPDMRHRLTFGGEYRPELFRGTGISSGQGEFTMTLHGRAYRGSEVKINYYAVYIQDEWDISPAWLLISSLRYDGSDRFSGRVSPKIGATYKAAPDTRLKFNLGTGFRVPYPNQLYLNLNLVRGGALVHLSGNPALRPETSWFYDISLERDFGGGTAKLTYFQSTIRDMIDETWTSPSTLQYRNIGRAALRGIEADFTRPLHGKFSWNLNYTYLNAVNTETHARLFDRARHKISAAVSYRPSDRWAISLWSDAYLGYVHQPRANEMRSCSYMLWNISAQCGISEREHLSLTAENLFNRRDAYLSIPGTILRLGYELRL